MATTTTPNLSLTLAVPGSNEPFDTNDVNANFAAIDTEVGTTRAKDSTQDSRLTAIEDLTLPTSATPNIGVIPSGTTADRDGFWGNTGAFSAAQRVALANKGARWFNLDKGYEQQYFANENDAGVTATTPVKNTSGWAPAMHLGLVPLSQFTVASTGGTIVKRGGAVDFSGAVSNIRLDGLFTADFADYLMIITVDSASASGEMNLQFRSAATTISSASYARSTVDAAVTLGPTRSDATAQVQITGVTRYGAVGGYGELRFRKPLSTAATKAFSYTSSDADVTSRYGTATCSSALQIDGIQIGSSAGTPTGRLRFFGINDF